MDSDVQTENKVPCPFGCGATLDPRGMGRHKSRCEKRPDLATSESQAEAVVRRLRARLHNARGRLKDALDYDADEMELGELRETYKSAVAAFDEYHTLLELIEGKDD